MVSAKYPCNSSSLGWSWLGFVRSLFSSMECYHTPSSYSNDHLLYDGLPVVLSGFGGFQELGLS